MKKIELLTPEQTAKLAEWSDKWTAIGLSTEPANRPEAERAIVMAYAAAKLPPPRIVWCDSPLSQALTRACVEKIFKDKASVGTRCGTRCGPRDMVSTTPIGLDSTTTSPRFVDYKKKRRHWKA